MNSKYLRDYSPDEYRGFFSRCVKVVSAPHVFFWTGDFSNFYGGLAICSKIPLRFYVGLEKISKDEFEINEKFRAYFSSKQGFCDIELDEYIVNTLKSFLAEDLKGYRIRFFSEIPLGASLGGLGAMSACLAKLLSDETEIVEKKATELTKSLQRGRKSAATALSCMVESSYPVIYSHEDSKPTAKSVGEVLNLPKDAIWPIDFGLVFSGKLVRGNAVISSAREMQEVSQNLQKEAREIMGSYRGSLWDDYLRILDHVAHQCLVGMKRVFSEGKESDITFLFSTLNQYQNLLYFLGVSTSRINEIYSAIHRNANYLENRVGSGCKITGVGRGGDVLFAVPYGEMRDNIDNTIGKITKRSQGEVCLDYASWKDGIESKGLIIEQDLQKKIFSNFIKKGMSLLEIFENSSKRTKIVSSGDICKEKIDLILDIDNRKIIYNGKKTDSSQILSQRATVEILDKILRAKNNQVSNKSLPASYGKNRFDLQSKLVLPLGKLTKLSFEISGGMYDDFTLKLKPFDISIGTIRKIS